MRRTYRIIKRLSFTLVEVIISMSAFIVIIAIVLKFYNSAYKATMTSTGNSMIFENARIAMDVMTRDLQCIYYKNEAVPFWHWAPSDPDNPPASWGAYRNELLAFVSATDLLPNDNCVSNLCEIKYQLYYSTNKQDNNNGWLRRSVTGDKTASGDNEDWNFFYNFDVGYTTSSSTPVSVFTANSNSSESYQKLIPYVTDLSFVCYDKDGSEVDSDHTTSTAADACQATPFPYSVKLSLSLMDKNSWEQWLSLFTEAQYPQDEPAYARDFRENIQRTFTKTIFIGDHGQYD